MEEPQELLIFSMGICFWERSGQRN